MSLTPLKILSAPEQVAAHLREEIAHGRLQGNMPGIHSLSSELGIHRTTTADALRILENDGLIVSQGAGKRRKIVPLTQLTARGLRVAILLYQQEDISSYRCNELRHQLDDSGHNVIVASKTLCELNNDVNQLKAMVQSTRADAWVVIAGSKEILKWFADSDMPCFALFGNSKGIPVPQIGPNNIEPLVQVTQKLLELNHRRICLLMNGLHSELKTEVPFIRAFKDTLRSYGISPSAYNVPDWQRNKESFQSTLTALFQHTPPTALIIEDVEHMLSVMQFLALKGIKPIQDISLFCIASESSFSWTEPVISHLQTDDRPWIRRVVQWVNNVAIGKKDIRKSYTKPMLIEGGTIGPAP